MTSLTRSEVERSSLDRRIWAWTCLRWVREVAEERAEKRVWWLWWVVGVAGFGLGGSAKAVCDMVVVGGGVAWRWKGLGVGNLEEMEGNTVKKLIESFPQAYGGLKLKATFSSQQKHPFHV